MQPVLGSRVLKENPLSFLVRRFSTPCQGGAGNVLRKVLRDIVEWCSERFAKDLKWHDHRCRNAKTNPLRASRAVVLSVARRTSAGTQSMQKRKNKPTASIVESRTWASRGVRDLPNEAKLSPRILNISKWAMRKVAEQSHIGDAWCATTAGEAPLALTASRRAMRADSAPLPACGFVNSAAGEGRFEFPERFAKDLKCPDAGCGNAKTNPPRYIVGRRAEYAYRRDVG
jgi:hypothetical protein